MDNRTFFERYRPTNLTEDPLPLKVLNHSIRGDFEMVGHALDWASQYLHQKTCPGQLLSPLLALIQTELKATDLSQCLSNYTNDETDGAANKDALGFQPLKLMQTVTTKVDEICLKYKEEFEKIETEFPSEENGVGGPKIYDISYHSIKNARRTLEDRMVIIPNLQKAFENIQKPAGYFAVFDGHNGPEAAAYGAAHLHRYLIASKDFPSSLPAAFLDAYTLTDNYFISKCRSEKIRSGSTAVTALIDSEYLTVAWVGDSQGILVREKEIMNLVSPHKPERDDEMKRIRMIGGDVLNLNGTWRVNGNLAVSRALGNFDYKDFIISFPEIASIKLDGTEEFLILACDGLWDEISSEKAAEIVRNFLTTSDDGCKAALEIVSIAKSSGSTDNITAIIVFFESVEVLKERYLSKMDLIVEESSNGNIIGEGETSNNNVLLKAETCEFVPKSDQRSGVSLEEDGLAESEAVDPFGLEVAENKDVFSFGPEFSGKEAQINNLDGDTADIDGFFVTKEKVETNEANLFEINGNEEVAQELISEEKLDINAKNGFEILSPVILDLVSLELPGQNVPIQGEEVSKEFGNGGLDEFIENCVDMNETLKLHVPTKEEEIGKDEGIQMASSIDESHEVLKPLISMIETMPEMLATIVPDELCPKSPVTKAPGNVVGKSKSPGTAIGGRSIKNGNIKGAVQKPGTQAKTAPGKVLPKSSAIMKTLPPKAAIPPRTAVPAKGVKADVPIRPATAIADGITVRKIGASKSVATMAPVGTQKPAPTKNLLPKATSPKVVVVPKTTASPRAATVPKAASVVKGALANKSEGLAGKPGPIGTAGGAATKRPMNKPLSNPRVGTVFGVRKAMVEAAAAAAKSCGGATGLVPKSKPTAATSPLANRLEGTVKAKSPSAPTSSRMVQKKESGPAAKTIGKQVTNGNGQSSQSCKTSVSTGMRPPTAGFGVKTGSQVKSKVGPSGGNKKTAQGTGAKKPPSSKETETGGEIANVLEKVNGQSEETEDNGNVCPNNTTEMSESQPADSDGGDNVA